MDAKMTRRDAGDRIKARLIDEIKAFVASEREKDGTRDLWGEPLVGFADAHHPYIRNIRNVAGEKHCLPEEVMPGASIIIAYFVPFDKSVPESNLDGEMASERWAMAYEETNAMFGRLNGYIVDTVRGMGYDAMVPPEAGVFYRDEIMSHWSFRHFAYAAGLGTFGLNNMLITEKGCAGRINTVVTDLDVEPDEPKRDEACLFRRQGICGACAAGCPSGALTASGFDRAKCFEQCLKNAAVYTEFGSSYASQAGDEAEASGSEVCGKCVVGLPCTYRIP